MATKKKTRKQTPEDFLRRIERLYGSVSRDIRRALKKANNRPEDLPEELWEEIEEKERKVLLLMIMGIGLSSMNIWYDWLRTQTPYQVPYRDVEAEMRRLAEQRAAWAARQVTLTTRRRLLDALKRQTPSATGGTTPKGLRDALAGVLSPSRARTNTLTEMRAGDGIGAEAVKQAARQAEDDAIDDYEGQQHPDDTRKLQAYLRLGSCNHCQVCPLFDRVDMDYVRRFFPDAMPIHPNCCCEQWLVYGAKNDLIRSGVMRADPDFATVMRTMGEIGFAMPVAAARARARRRNR